MSGINPAQVIKFMEFNLAENLPPETTATHHDIYLAKMLYQMIISVANSAAFDIIPDTTLDFRESYEKSTTYEAERSPTPPSEEYVPIDLPAPSTSRYDDPDLEYKRRAVEYWRSYKKGYKVRRTTRSLQSVREKFKLVKSISQLHVWKNYIDRGGSRFDKSKLIASLVLDKFREEAGVNNIIHDVDVQNWAQEANKQVGFDNFLASRTWLFNFKKNNNIIRRDVGKLIVRAKEGIVTTEQLQLAEQFRALIQNERILQSGVENVFNAAEYPLNSTFSVILIISAAGKLLSPLTITVANEQKISPEMALSLESQIPGLHIIRGGFERQNVDEMIRWFDKVYIQFSSPQNCLLVDYKLAAIRDLLSQMGQRYLTNIDVIPYGTEFMLEPLEEGFKVWKRFVKAINDYIDTSDDCDFDRRLANNIVKIQAFVHVQLTADRYSGFFQNAWRKFGYLRDEEPAQEYIDPITFAFGRALRSNLCSYCSDESLLRCAKCEKFICFDHALVTLNPLGFHSQ